MERSAPAWAARRDPRQLASRHPLATPREIRATAVLFALGSLLTLADALQTQWLLRDHRFTERFPPVHWLITQLGTDAALALASFLAITAMGLVAAAAVYVRRPVSTVAFTALAVAVLVRGLGCVSNFGLIIH